MQVLLEDYLDWLKLLERSNELHIINYSGTHLIMHCLIVPPRPRRQCMILIPLTIALFHIYKYSIVHCHELNWCNPTRWPKATSPPQELKVGGRRPPYLLFFLNILMDYIHFKIDFILLHFLHSPTIHSLKTVLGK